MSYQKAMNVLPAELIEQIQNYVDGEYIYIPRKSGMKKSWGSNTSTQEELRIRNQSIYEDYLAGMKAAELAEKYFLSEKSIWRIVGRQK